MTCNMLLKHDIHMWWSLFRLTAMINVLSTGQRINELEIGPSSYRQKKHLFRVGFHEASILV